MCTANYAPKGHADCTGCPTRPLCVRVLEVALDHLHVAILRRRLPTPEVIHVLFESPAVGTIVPSEPPCHDFAGASGLRNVTEWASRAMRCNASSLILHPMPGSSSRRMAPSLSSKWFSKERRGQRVDVAVPFQERIAAARREVQGAACSGREPGKWGSIRPPPAFRASGSGILHDRADRSQSTSSTAQCAWTGGPMAPKAVFTTFRTAAQRRQTCALWIFIQVLGSKPPPATPVVRSCSQCDRTRSSSKRCGASG